MGATKGYMALLGGGKSPDSPQASYDLPSGEGRDVSVLLSGSESLGSPHVSTEKHALRSGPGYHRSFRNEELVSPEMRNRLLEVKWQVSGQVRTQHPCPWLQNQRAPKAQDKPAPTDNEKSNRPKDSGSLPSQPARPQGQKAHKVCAIIP